MFQKDISEPARQRLTVHVEDLHPREAEVAVISLETTEVS